MLVCITFAANSLIYIGMKKLFLFVGVVLIGIASWVLIKGEHCVVGADECDTLTSNNMKTLVIVDFQYDFADPNGSLYVKGAEEAQKNVVELIRKGGFDNVILTRDWHKTCDKSFKENGGIWPVHCVEGTSGAQVMDEIINVLDEVGANYVYSNKGTNPDVEEYGAFSSITRNEAGTVTLHNVDDSHTITLNANAEIVVCGIAGDYCVYETTKNLVDCDLFNVSVYLPGVASIDGGAKITEYSEQI